MESALGSTMGATFTNTGPASPALIGLLHVNALADRLTQGIILPTSNTASTIPLQGA
jgi:hypothetical protein